MQTPPLEPLILPPVSAKKPHPGKAETYQEGKHGKCKKKKGEANG